MVLTNPPFGKKSSITVIGEDGEDQRESLTIVRVNFWATTSNKQLNFVQHVRSLLMIDGRAAMVVPDNVLFEGGAGETIRRCLLHDCDVHTLLRLPTGIFYAQSVKANVIFFDRRIASEELWTKKLWIYDFRTNQHFTLKTNLLRRENLDDFVECYHAENRAKRKESDCFHAFTYEELVKRDKASLDIFWLKDESLEDASNLPAQDVIANEIVEDLQAALDEFSPKLQPQWLESVYDALNDRNANLQLATGVRFSYRCPDSDTRTILDHIARTWIACAPLVNILLGA